MTLGGLALAVGVLVDEATVEIENIHTQMLPGVSRARAVVEACSRTALARLLSMFCILAVFVPSFFMIGVGGSCSCRLSLAVAFSMIASYLLSSSLVPVFSTWLMRRSASRRRARRIVRRLRSFYGAICRSCCGSAGRWWSVIWPWRFGLLYLLLPRMGTEMFPDANAPLYAYSPSRAGGHADRGDRANRSARARRHQARRRAGECEITSDFMGVLPSSYPVDLIHLFTSGPQEAIIQVALKAGRAARRSAARKHARRHRRRSCPVRGLVRGRRHRDPGDELRIADAHRSGGAGESLADDYAYAQKIQSADARSWLFFAICSSRRSSIIRRWTSISDRDRAGQFGLTMADVAALRRAGDIFLALHSTELLARSEFRQGISDPGATSAEPNAERRCA